LLSQPIEDLPGGFAVWAATTEAEFLHGRFVWANWDIDELKAGDIGKKIKEDAHFLQVGMEGLAESMGSPMLEELKKMAQAAQQ
jgi:hypothetical protein